MMGKLIVNLDNAMYTFGFKRGFHVLGANLPICPIHYTTREHNGDCRLEVFDGVDRDPMFTVTKEQSVTGQVTAALKQLQTMFPEEDWALLPECGRHGALVRRRLHRSLAPRAERNALCRRRARLPRRRALGSARQRLRNGRGHGRLQPGDAPLRSELPRRRDQRLARRNAEDADRPLFRLRRQDGRWSTATSSSRWSA